MDNYSFLYEYKRDVIRAKYFKMDNNEYFGDMSVFVLKVPVGKHDHPEVIEVMGKKLQNLQIY